MIKKMVIAATAAAALSVPLAGVAWAEPPADPGSNGVGEGGMPKKLGEFADSGITPSLSSPYAPIPPGEEFNLAKDTHDLLHPGVKVSTPTAIGEFESVIWGSGHQVVDPATSVPSTGWDNITPGLAIKPLGPGCGKGNTGLPYLAPDCVH
jgi:hypothetical protein